MSFTTFTDRGIELALLEALLPGETARIRRWAFLRGGRADDLFVLATSDASQLAVLLGERPDGVFAARLETVIATAEALSRARVRHAAHLGRAARAPQIERAFLSAGARRGEWEALLSGVGLRAVNREVAVAG